jgi:hypothetical protein
MTLHDDRGPIWLILELLTGPEAGYRNASIVPADCVIAYSDVHWRVVATGPLTDTTGLQAACAASGIEVPSV